MSKEWYKDLTNIKAEELETFLNSVKTYAKDGVESLNNIVASHIKVTPNNKSCSGNCDSCSCTSSKEEKVLYIVHAYNGVNADNIEQSIVDFDIVDSEEKAIKFAEELSLEYPNDTFTYSKVVPSGKAVKSSVNVTWSKV